MPTVYQQLRERFARAIAKAVPVGSGPFHPLLRESADPRFGDAQCDAAMGIAKALKRPPREVANAIVDNLDAQPLCAGVEIAGPGFINVRLNPDFLAAHLAGLANDPRLGVDRAETPVSHVVDFSSPNLAKEMHIGHLRTTVTGEAICRLLEFFGHPVERVNHVGDWGTQFGMLLEHVRESRPEALGNPEGLKLADLEAFYREAKAHFDADAEFAERARRRVVALQSGDAETLGLWRAFRAESLRHCREIYDLLGVKLRDVGESFYNDRLAGVVKELLDGGIARLDAGAACVFLPEFTGRDGSPLPFLIRKSDGGYNYAATDLAAMKYRVGELGARRVIIVTDVRQAQHFAMLFATARAAGWIAPGVRLDHIGYGMILGPDKRPYRTRDGGTVRLKDVLLEAVERARRIVSENERSGRSYTEDEAGEIARAVGLAAVKYGDLSHNLASDYVFDWDRMLAMDGNTAPYMLYALARIRSIGRKGGVDLEAPAWGESPVSLAHPSEAALAKILIRFGDVVMEACEALQPNLVTDYLFRLSKAFNLFYDRRTGVRVLDAETEDAKQGRLTLCRLTARALALGLELIGIRGVARM